MEFFFANLLNSLFQGYLKLPQIKRDVFDFLTSVEVLYHQKSF